MNGRSPVLSISTVPEFSSPGLRPVSATASDPDHAAAESSVSLLATMSSVPPVAEICAIVT